MRSVSMPGARMTVFLKSALKALMRPTISFAYKSSPLREFSRSLVSLLPKSIRQRALEIVRRLRPHQLELRPPTREVSENAEWLLRILDRRGHDRTTRG